MLHNWFKKTIARKLLFAFFFIFLITYLVTALVVQGSVRSAVTDAELDALSQLARLKLNGLNAKFDQLSTNLRAWGKLDVMNDIASGDVDKRVENTLVNLKSDYAIKGELYAFNAAGQLVASSDPQQKTARLPDAWAPQDKTTFVSKHINPLDNDEIVALSIPIMATFSADYRLGTMVMALHWSDIRAALPEQSILLYHKDSSGLTPGVQALGKPQPVSAHNESLILLESKLGIAVPGESLFGLAHFKGWTTISKNDYLVSSAYEDMGLLSGWEVVTLRDPDQIYQTVHLVTLKLYFLCLILTLPLIFVIRWLAGRLTAPLRDLTQFVSEISGTHDLSRRLKLNTDDEIGVLATNFNDMAERLESGSRARHESETRLRATIDNALDAVVQMNSEGAITGWNDQANVVFGWTGEEVAGRMLHETIIPPQYREAHVQGLQRFLRTGEGRVLNMRLDLIGLHRDGHEFPIELSIASIMMEGAYEFSGFIRDITEKKKSEEMIWRQANFDKVTGLPNRHMLHDRLEQEIKKAQRTSSQMALLFIDLDRFKEVNDTLGHDMGDILLVETARRICKCVRESDTVARLGGDEFTVILPEVSDTSNIERVAQCILKALSEPFHMVDEVAYISASIGVTLCPDDATNVEDMLKNADQAMYVAKNLGRNQSSYFTPALQELAQERRRLTHDLRSALENNELLVYFQPIADMATGRIQKAEALIRWQHPERGLVSPLGFVLLAEETGLITGIGDWVFKEVARWAKRWHEQFASTLQISVNVSPVQFMSDELSCAAWGEHLRSIGLNGQHIVIEITEGLLLKAATSVTAKLLQFRDAGIQVAVDDFGTGYSSLSYLKRFDIDYLKIDKSFVDNLETDMNDVALSEAIIVMAHKLGLKVIAEGVETEVQREILARAGCDYAQGFLFSRPVPPEVFEALLRKNNE